MPTLAHANRLDMLLVVVTVAAVVVLLIGGFFPAVQVLLWVGLAVAVLTALMILYRAIDRRRHA